METTDKRRVVVPRLRRRRQTEARHVSVERDGYGCPFGCKERFATFSAARIHAAKCPTRKRRLDNLGLDLVVRVDRGELKLEAAEAIQAKRPALRL
jgi:hypothetical protein